ncbi:MAG: gliding motility-associated C-terminal domain-containing protein [Imperialibacter sp.]|uniref:gliding motility-associated C-terminal domain-containing protein n=1 Tax=Imperialibacter sp. TaxID=2038411 RepID=UPI0032EF8A95
MDNWLQDPNNPIRLELYISADDTTSGIVDMPLVSGWQPLQFTVIPGVTTSLSVPANVAMAFGSGLVQNKGIHITTEKNVSVYAMNKRQYSADMALILPVYSLGSDYFAMSHWESGNRDNNSHSDSELLIVAVSDGTEIEITPSVNAIGAQPAGTPFLVTLNQGQVYQLQAGSDLTGTHIRSVNTVEGTCSNFAVFGGNRYTKVGQCEHPDGHDHLFAQMYPVDTWGKEYITVPFASRLGGDLVKVLAAEEGTNVTVNNVAYELARGEFKSFIQREVTAVKSDKPVSVAQFSLSQGCDGTTGDPFVVMISPNEQLMKKITFNAPSIATISKYEVTIISPSSSTASLTFDNNDISSRFAEVPQSPGYSFATLQSSGGNHTIRSGGDGFIAYVYGYGNNESFGYPTGAALGNLKVDFNIISTTGQLLAKDSLCPTTSIYFEPVSEFEFDHYVWDFGDDSTLISDSKQAVAHAYAEPGEYLIRLIASTGLGECGNGNQETSIKLVNARYPSVEVLGPRSVCPNTHNVVYKVENGGGYDLTWRVEGGAVNSFNGDSISVNWGQTSSTAFVGVVATNRFGCAGAQSIFPVKINIQLEPEAPFGPDSLCVSSAKAIPYGTYFTEGSTYNWQVSNGSIASGQGKHQVRVDWLEPGSGWLWFEQLTSTDTLCAGFSDSLQVFLQRQPSGEAIIDQTPERPYILQETVLQLHADPLFTLVNWDFGDGTTLDSVPVIDVVKHTYTCQGVYDVTALAYDSTILCDTETQVSKQVTVLAPPLELLRVTHSEEVDNTIQVDWTGLAAVEGYDKPQFLYRRTNSPVASAWRLLATLTDSESGYLDQSLLETKYNSYAYRLETNTDCEENIATSIHESILLTGSASDDHASGSITWNDYAGWQHGTKRYEVWRQVDDGEFELQQTVTGNGFDFSYEEDGFTYCFRVKAFEQDGNNQWSLSNEACINFEPKVFAYNVFTPNNDGLNECFIIEGVELYTQSLLTVVDRSGHEVFSKVGYKNDWDGTRNGQPLPTGVYYYVLELNEPRVALERVNGDVSIMR